MLNINFIKQFNNYSCGAACLQMVYSFYGLKVPQKEIYDLYVTESKEDSLRKIINIEDLVEDAKQRGFISQWIRLPENLRNEKGLEEFIDNNLLNNQPLIFCQQFTRMNKTTGHFRVLVGRDNNNIIVHDPHPKFGKSNRVFTIKEFLEYWEPTGKDVTGWVYVVISK